ncbi:GTP 3',8-cyclase MoaA [Paenibacillus wynnii]|uniref:GTP 3',8-cyclase MoaA n=1 Tax=Paenibacillus wynnii TaxID=268407 RepID=UPI00278E1074|nr:cyclic pyranopterin phosphate synthase [Paenibacillus wynnii]
MGTEILMDQLQRPIRDLRISVTDRCNLRCQYCMPKEIFGDDYAFLPEKEQLTFDEIMRLADLFASLGVKKIRLTGGEPLMRRNLAELVQRLVQLEGVDDIGLTTNGMLLNAQAYDLYNAGLRRLNISLDALDAKVLAAINGRGVKPSVILANIEYARSIGFQIKVNMVVRRGMNEQEILPMATFFKEYGVTLCFIEFMDVGNDNGWNLESVVSKQEIFDHLQAEYTLEPVEQNYYGEVAKRYRYKGSKSEIGFITSVSESFCSTCTRARLSSDGKMFTCLFAEQGFDLRDLIRGGASDAELLATIRQVWEQRADRYSDERATHMDKSRSKIGMSYIGG